MFSQIGFFLCCSRGPEVRVHLKLDSWLQFVHPSAMAPLSWKVTEEVNCLLYLQRPGCWSSVGMQHALGGNTHLHLVRICRWYLNRPPSAIVIGGRSSDKILRVYLIYSFLIGRVWKDITGQRTTGMIKCQGWFEIGNSKGTVTRWRGHKMREVIGAAVPSKASVLLSPNQKKRDAW